MIRPRTTSAQWMPPDSRGAAILEFTLVIGLFLFGILLFFDIAHYFSVRMLMLRSAQRALTIASTDPRLQKETILSSALPPVDANTTVIAADPNGDYSQYIKIRREVVTAATSFPYGANISPPDSDGLVSLMPFNANDEFSSGANTVSGFPAAVIRPGDVWYSSLQGRLISHPDICSPVVDAACTSARPPGTDMRQLLQNYPIIVMVEAKKRSFVAWGQEIPITVAAVGWAQIYPKSPYDLQNGLAGAAPTPTPTPCPKTPPTCVNWSQISCACADEQPCPGGEHWNPQYDDPRCSSCPLAESYMPGKAPPSAPSCPSDRRYVDWKCYCDCLVGSACSTGAGNTVPGSQCTECLEDKGMGEVGH